MGTFIYRSATDLAQLIRSGETTSTAVVREHLQQIERHNPTLNAVVELRKEEALKEASAYDAEASEGAFRGPLHGVPMTIKDQFWVSGTRSTMNSKLHRDWVAREDSELVKRLRRAGVVILGKTNVPKNLTDYQVSGDIYPEGKNPYDTDCSPGGSSGGASAALASGMVPLELGGDFGGSIRNPSNFCGLYGMKPTEDTVPGHGMVPVPEGARGFTFHMAQAGPMARTLDDMELMWKILRGPHTGSRTTPRIEWKPPKGKSLGDYKVAWVDRWPTFDTSGHTKRLIANLVGQLEANGCSMEEAGPAEELHERSLRVFIRLFGQLISQDMPRFIKPLVKRSLKKGLLNGFDGYRTELNVGFKGTFIDYSETMGLRAGVVQEWEEYFQEYDLLICPMSVGPAFKRCPIGTPITCDGRTMPYVEYVWPFTACFNATGHPSMNLPLGLSDDGLPVGVQIVGPYWSEPDLIQFARLASTLTAGFVRPEGY